MVKVSNFQMNAHCASCKMHPIAHTMLTLPHVSSPLPGQQLSKITEPAHHLCHLDPTQHPHTASTHGEHKKDI